MICGKIHSKRHLNITRDSDDPRIKFEESEYVGRVCDQLENPGYMFEKRRSKHARTEKEKVLEPDVISSEVKVRHT